MRIVLLDSTVRGTAIRTIAALFVCALVACGERDRAEAGEELAGGATTVFDASRNAFSFPPANLSSDRQTDFFIGNSFFKKNWVEAPASTNGRDGLGPHFIARSCGACHALDGRGAPPTVREGASVEQPVGLLLRLSVPGDGGKDGIVPEPTYGGQLNVQAIQGVKAEARVRIRYEEIEGRFADGERYSLRKPVYTIVDPAYGAPRRDMLVSPRIAPQMIGLGLLEAIREQDILANAERQARENTSVTGRPNRVWDRYADNWVIGRFGWKANVGSVAHQDAGAFAGDIGITSPRFAREECTAAQKDCLAAIMREAVWRRERGESNIDIDDRTLNKVIFYTRLLAVPARREWERPEVLRGKRVFNESGCASCHVPAYRTGQVEGLPELSDQTIRPYTDLLLHDMGEGLADGRPDFAADGREWRTPPLWGIGLFKTVNGHTFYMHDGRARNLTEAVLWHGGEAETAKRRFLERDKKDRTALLRFLESL
ncbi:MAG TPA: di-heme oxidoredictase family protein [Burkholderiales bacterium]|nr:di-heme oxidoredictase family protein [Burkholderiales bacterium]